MLYSIIKKIILYYIKVFLYYIFRLFPINNKKLFIQNFNGKGYGDNPKYIIEEILRRSLNFKIVWAVRPELSKDFPKNVKTVPYKNIRAIYEEATAKIWIDNCRKQTDVRKRKQQFYIQTWHGAIGLKKVEKDVEHQLSAYYVKQAKYDSTMINLFLSDSTFTSQIYRSSFWYNGEILECGSPRDDILVNYNYHLKNKVKRHFNIDNNTKIILYAPTFRENFDVSVYNIDYKSILNVLEKKTKENWVFLLKLHPNISGKSSNFLFNNQIFNASNYCDMQELLFAGDILISDYSSCIYEFAIMNKQVFLFINDYEQYRKERNFYLDPFSLPFPCSTNNEELLYNIINVNTAQYINSLDNFFIKVGLIRDGNASSKVVDRIITEMEKKK
jgi:CDP-glycerol glycerophosphotransferase